jgi:hypothetical protein
MQNKDQSGARSGDHTQHLDRSSVGGRVELKVDGPDHVRGIGLRRVGGARPQALASTPLRNAQVFLAPQPLDLLVVHAPALAASVVIRRSEPAPRMVFRVLAQPRIRVGICRACAGRCSSLRSSVLPGHPAGEPLTHTHDRQWCTAARRRSGLRSLPERSPSTPPSPTPHRPAAA